MLEFLKSYDLQESDLPNKKKATRYNTKAVEYYTSKLVHLV